MTGALPVSRVLELVADLEQTIEEAVVILRQYGLMKVSIQRGPPRSSMKRCWASRFARIGHVWAPVVRRVG